jgi:hypothetical protein
MMFTYLIASLRMAARETPFAAYPGDDEPFVCPSLPLPVCDLAGRENPDDAEELEFDDLLPLKRKKRVAAC